MVSIVVVLVFDAVLMSGWLVMNAASVSGRYLRSECLPCWVSSPGT